jgi:hypothetical protein
MLSPGCDATSIHLHLHVQKCWREEYGREYRIEMDYPGGLLAHVPIHHPGPCENTLS